MSERSRETQKRRTKNTQMQRVTRTDLKKSTEYFQGERQNIFPVGETPFRPSIKKHLKILAEAGSVEERANVISYLQQSYGNRYVQSLVASIEVQAKLNISQPGDLQEQQADRVAEVVGRVIETEIQRQPEEEKEEEEIQQITKPLQRQIEEEEEKIPSPPEEEEQIPSPPEEEESQTRLTRNQSVNISEALEERINNTGGGGQALSAVVLEPMERAFGVDFNDVRVHTDAEANGLNKSLKARAFTKGNDIFFRQGEYSPGSGDGRKLLAHELTHVVQQTRGGEYVNRLQETIDVQVGSEPLQEGITEASPLNVYRDVEMSNASLDLDKKLPVMTLPDPATMGGVVIVKSQKFEAWINPGEPACVLGGIKAHEEKHISDFEADSYYSTIPKSGKIADGHCVYYQNNADAKKFENAAIDVEIEWLKKKRESNLSSADKAIVDNRMNVTLPAYRASFG